MENLIRERSWMYNQRVTDQSYNNDAFNQGVGVFIQTAYANGHIFEGSMIRCPCSKCKHNKFIKVQESERHLFTFEFVGDYYNWTLHGEEIAHTSYPAYQHHLNENDTSFMDQQMPDYVHQFGGVDSHFADMVHDVAEPNEDASKFYDLFQSSCQPVFEGCTSETQLSISMKLLQTKTDHGLSEAAYDSLCGTINNLLDCDNRMPKSFRETKRLVSDLGMGFIRIDVCISGCMIYYGEDESMTQCPHCKEARYKEDRNVKSSASYQRISRSQMFYLPIIPRLQRLFLNATTASNMTWHALNNRDRTVMVHPSDGESWKHFDMCYPEFADESRNVRLGLCSDGFSPGNMSSKPYSCWSVMLTPYNLPPWMCMKTRFMWLTIMIPGPHNPKKGIDIYLRPLLDDLQLLWNDGVPTYDAFRKQNFNMRAALMWTVSDFPAYGMLSGWSTQGRLGCPYCMEETKSFFLQHGRKVSYFDCHRRFLPQNHPYRHDSMHFFKGRTEYASPIDLRDGHATFERVSGLKPIWEQSLNEKLPGFGTLHNWTKKSIFWELPYWVNIKLRHNLDVMHIEKNVFDNLFNTIMNVKGKSKYNGIKCRKDLALYCSRPELECQTYREKLFGPKAKYALSVAQQTIVCEWIKGLQFPDGYVSRLGNHVDVEQRKLHLPIRVAEEIVLGGPVHYRWMYPFERFIYRLKKMAKNKAFIEASIVQAYLQQETSFIGSDYLGSEFQTNARRVKRNKIISGETTMRLFQYNYPGIGSGRKTRRVLTIEEFRKATHYILSNTPEFDIFFSDFAIELTQLHPEINENQIYYKTLKSFPDWVKQHVWSQRNAGCILPWIQYVATEFDWNIISTSTYKISNYKFHTEMHSAGRSTTNCHIHVKGTTQGVHYYGILEEILHARCHTAHNIKVVLFKCRWVDPQFVKIYPANGVVEINLKRLYTFYDPFILAQQAEQVYFAEFPGLPNKTRQGWFAVCRVKPTNAIDISIADVPFQDEDESSSEMPLVSEFLPLTTMADDTYIEYSDESDDCSAEGDNISSNSGEEDDTSDMDE
ncbi:hypothetical protein QQ045_002038 [Rhodiola kirilowii]